MKPDEYLQLLAVLDKQQRRSKSPEYRRLVEEARRHLSALYEEEKAKARPNAAEKPKKMTRTLDAELFLREIRRQCMLETVAQKGNTQPDDYNKGRQAGFIEAFDQIYDLVSKKIRGEA